MAPRLVVFDLDGTLVDSRRDLAESANLVLEECGCRIHLEEAIGRMVGDGAATLVARVFAAAGCAQPPDALARFLSTYDARLLRHTRCYPGVLELLEALKERVTLAVLTNKPLAATRAILDGLALAPFFHGRVVGGDGPFPKKPDPAGLLHVMARANVPPDDTMLVGDSVVDLRTARAARSRSCLARYGFGFAGFPLEELTSADHLIDQPLELLSAL